jgi:hypothetical protein
VPNNCTCDPLNPREECRHILGQCRTQLNFGLPEAAARVERARAVTRPGSQSEREAKRLHEQLNAMMRVNELTEENRRLMDKAVMDQTAIAALQRRVEDLELMARESGELGLAASESEGKLRKMVAELEEKLASVPDGLTGMWESGRRFERARADIRERSLLTQLKMAKEDAERIRAEFNNAIAGDISGDITGLIIDEPTV